MSTSRLARCGAFLALCGLAACAGQHKPPPPSTDIDETGFRDALRLLASDDFAGRRPGTAGEDKTVALLITQFKKLKLKPGNGESYLQQVPMIEFTAGADATLAFLGHGAPHSLQYGKDMVIWSKRQDAVAGLRQSDVVFVGYGIVAPEYKWNDYAGVDVRGKTVLVLAGDPGYASKEAALFRGRSMSSYGRPSYKAAEAARQGAAGLLMIHDGAALGFGWNVIMSTWMAPQVELASMADAANHAMVEGWISNESAHTLFVQAGLDLDALAGRAALQGFKAIDTQLAVDAQLRETTTRFNSANVIAVLQGEGRKRDYVVYCAHWDHLGRAAGGSVYPGAVDDATGVAGLLMLAQSFSRTKPLPDRSIAFIAFTGGEAGLLGSAYYVANPVLPLQQTAGVIDLDTLRDGGRTRDLVIYDAGNSEMEESVRGAALLQGRELRAEPHPEYGIYYRSDLLNFALMGVPGIYAQGGIDDAARGPAWGQAQIDDYMAHRYRQTSDKYSENWDVSGAVEDLSLYYDLGDRLARTRRFPRWYPSSEFSQTHRHDRDAAESE